MNRTLNREQAFAEHVSKKYEDLKLVKQQKQNAQKPTEPEVKVNGNNAGLQIHP